MDNPASRALRNLISPGRIDAGARIESPNLRFFRRTALLPPPSAAVHCVRPVGIPPVGLFSSPRSCRGARNALSKGVRIDRADLAFLSPYPTSKLKRFGDFPTYLQPEIMPATTTLPM
jgi:hypothetical protein